MEKLSIQIENKISEVNRLSLLIEEFGEKNSLPPDVVFDVSLSLDELVTNIVSYGFPDGEKSKIEVNITLNETEILVELIDYGIEFDPTKIPDPDVTLSIDERKIGGLGIFFVRQKMNEIKYARVNNRNVLTLKKKLIKNGVTDGN
ncbi:MAG TPA: ATP-binding protein [Ignavibacteriaceae bacterium]|nr:ATP-binding protein [Ignavibacteriaceae bacterium]